MNRGNKSLLIIGIIIICLLIGWYYYNSKLDFSPQYTINLVGNESITLYQYDTYVEEGYSAFDKSNKDVTDNVDVINYVNTAKEGTYEVVYAIDGVVKKRTVNVINRDGSKEEEKTTTVPTTTTRERTTEGAEPTTSKTNTITSSTRRNSTTKIKSTSKVRPTITTRKATSMSRRIVITTPRRTSTTVNSEIIVRPKTTTRKSTTTTTKKSTTTTKRSTITTKKATTTTKKVTTTTTKKVTTTTKKVTTTTKKITTTTKKITTTTKRPTTTTRKPTTTTKRVTTTTKKVTTTKAPIISDDCKKGIKTTNLKGMHGVAMRSWGVYPKEDAGSYTRTISAGETFEILGENDANYHWAIIYNNECGWVNSNHMAINLKDYIPSITYIITNASSSIFKSSEKNIPDLTGKKLYTNQFNDFVPARYQFAKKLKNAQAAALAKGDSIIIYDAYRPTSVSKYANTKLTSLYNSDAVVKANIDYSYDSNGNRYSWGQAWFLAQGYSAHNYACAVDASLRIKNGSEYTMPSAMHELSTKAIKYKNPSASNNSSAYYSDGVKNSVGAQRLSDYMMNGGGLNDLASEWWHYQDTSCMSGAIGDFWSNV